MHKDSILTIVMAHGAAIQTVERHLPIWSCFSNNIVFVCPEDDALSPMLGHSVYRVGKKCHHCEHSNSRVKACFAIGKNWPGLIILHEYDSIALDLNPAMLPDRKGLSSYKVKNRHTYKYLSPYYPWFPQYWYGEGMKSALAAMLKAPVDCEHGMSDRYIGYAINQAGIPFKDLGAMNFCFGRNTISYERDLSFYVDAIKKGASQFHGVKDGKVLHSILETAEYVDSIK